LAIPSDLRRHEKKARSFGKAFMVDQRITSPAGSGHRHVVLLVAVVLRLIDAKSTAADQQGSKSASISTGRIVARLGKREVILPSGRYGLKYFPDECLAFVPGFLK
jgi:hypothetical protein